MNIKTGIERAKDGGYKVIYNSCSNCDEMYINSDTLNIEKILLDINFWMALGDVMDWVDGAHPLTGSEIGYEGWRNNMHRMIDHLAEGKTVEESFDLVTQ